MQNLDLFGDTTEPERQEGSSVPGFEVRFGVAVCIRPSDGAVLAAFEGVAYDSEQRLYVWTTLRAEGRSYIELGSPTYQGALVEAEVLANQSTFDF
jgi:hypothetical protein